MRTIPSITPAGNARRRKTVRWKGTRAWSRCENLFPDLGDCVKMGAREDPGPVPAARPGGHLHVLGHFRVRAEFKAGGRRHPHPLQRRSSGYLPVRSRPGPILLGQERDVRLRVLFDETRPLPQGARLTACELRRGADTPIREQGSEETQTLW